jgi:hypothetical protein
MIDGSFKTLAFVEVFNVLDQNIQNNIAVDPSGLRASTSPSRQEYVIFKNLTYDQNLKYNLLVSII